MKYKPEVKLEVIDLYRGGMPRRRISESKGIPLSTVRSWTQDIVSAEATQIKCVVCGKKKRTLNIKQLYCSISCKNRANYRPRQVVVPDMRISTPSRQVVVCGYVSIVASSISHGTATLSNTAERNVGTKHRSVG